MIGKTLSHFRILEKLGEGGMGVVYKAEDRSLRRLVALKVLPPEAVGDEERRLRFVREARAAAAVTHPNIATVYEVGEAGGTVFIAMEHVQGRTLRSLISGRPLSIKDAVPIAAQIAEGLAAAHQARVIHRDLKPDNVMLSRDNQVKILDFGLAKLLDEGQVARDAADSRVETISGERTRVGKVLGTPAYMSPEQARGQAVDARSDIFSFGTMLHEMVTGEAPFQGKTPTDLLTAIIRDDPPPASQLNSEVPAELDRIIAQCLEKHPQDRYLHTDQLAMDLRKLKRTTDSAVRAIRTEGAGARRVASSRTSRIFARPLVWALAVGLAGLAGVVVWRWMGPVRGFKYRDKILVADFENATGRPEFDTAVRDAFEERIAQSSFFDVITSGTLSGLLKTYSGGTASRLDWNLASRICREGACSGFLMGKLAPTERGLQIEALLYRAGITEPVLSSVAIAASEQNLVRKIHEMVLDIRRRIGEAPAALAATTPPTTDSLSAYDAFVVGSRVDTPSEQVGLYKQALQIDPEFVDAYSALANAYFSHGEWQEYRKVEEQAYRHAARLPDQQRRLKEIDYLDAAEDYDTELDRLKTYQHLYSDDSRASDDLAFLYSHVYQDMSSAETAARKSYELSPTFEHLSALSGILLCQGKGDDIDALVSKYRQEKPGEAAADELLLFAPMARGDWKGVALVAQRLQQGVGLARSEGLRASLEALLGSGRLAEAEGVSRDLWRAAVEAHDGGKRMLAEVVQAWLRMRRHESPEPLSAEVMRLARGGLIFSSFAVLSLDVGLAEPLAEAIQARAQEEKKTQSRFLHDELQFARGCLLLIQGRAGNARELLEPLTRNSLLFRRHRALGKTYESLRMWREAAQEYEIALKNPNLKWMRSEISAFLVLDQFHLAQAYDHIGQPERARPWYERFLTDWKEGDADIPEVAAARKHLAGLGTGQTPPS